MVLDALVPALVLGEWSNMQVDRGDNGKASADHVVIVGFRPGWDLGAWCIRKAKSLQERLHIW